MNNNNTMWSNKKFLDKRHLAIVAEILLETEPGIYSVKALWGDRWALKMVRPQAYGKWFKASVRRGDIAGVRWIGTSSNKSASYRLMSADEMAAEARVKSRERPG